MKFLIIFFFSIIQSTEITSIYNIKGMMCSENCPKIIKNSISDLKGIKSCNINFNNETATITYDDDLIKSDEIEKIITNKTYFKVKKQPSSPSIWNWLFNNYK